MDNPDSKRPRESFLKRIDSIFSRIESAILIIILGSMIFFAFLQVILRNFFASGIIWGDILLRHLVLWVGFLGASLATRENRHISINALSRILSPAWKRRVHFMINLFSTVICVLLIRAAYVFVRDERASGMTLFLGIPAWLFMIIIFIGFVMMAFRFLLKVFYPSIWNQDISVGE